MCWLGGDRPTLSINFNQGSRSTIRKMVFTIRIRYPAIVTRQTIYITLDSLQNWR